MREEADDRIDNSATESLRLCPDGDRIVLRPFHIVGPEESPGGDERLERIVARILSLSADELERELTGTIDALEARHDNVRYYLEGRFSALRPRVPALAKVDPRQAQLIGAFFTEEFSIEAAALFNPSVVPHFDQSDLPPGDTRFILSLRGIGEGHISSLLFQTGVWHADGEVTLDARGPRAAGPETITRAEGDASISLELPTCPIGERVIFPFLPRHGRGIEDVRLCRFTDDDGSVCYRGTFTAFDGEDMHQAAFTTEDFRRFELTRMNGDISCRKGAAWFPRRIDGRFAILCKRDDEAICLGLSENPHEWDGGDVVVSPKFPWEFV